MTTTLRVSDTWRPSAVLTALTACMLIGAAGASHAATSAEPPAVKVSYSDLNLTSAAGTEVLYARIVSAARTVCGSRDADIRDLGALARAQACETRAITEAVHAVHNPALAALSDARVRHG